MKAEIIDGVLILDPDSVEEAAQAIAWVDEYEAYKSYVQLRLNTDYVTAEMVGELEH
jgi:hypothetical protein